VARIKYKVLNVGQHSVTMTDNTKWEGELCTVECSKFGIEGVRVGDMVSATTQTQNPMVVVDPFLETGAKAAEQRPTPFVAPVVTRFEPNAADQPFRTPEGYPLSPDDIDQMIREQQKQIAALVADVKFLKCFTREHCGHCQAIIASESAFR
jgi:hypothetical protein